MRNTDSSGLRLCDFFIISFFMDATVSCAGLLANYYAQDIGATKLQVGLKDFVWGATYMFACLVAGQMADRFPRRALLIVGIALQGLSAWVIQWCQTPTALIAVMPLNALGCALFWPVFMTLLHDPNATETNRRIGWFNLGWTSGLSVGLAVSGTLARWDAHKGFQIIGLAAALNLLYFCLRTRSKDSGIRVFQYSDNDPTAPPREHVHTSIHPYAHTRRSYLYLAWVSSFILFFASSATGNQFPVLARALGIRDDVSSALYSLTIVGLGACSFLMSRTTRWHYRLAPLFGAKALALCALALLLVATSPLAFGVGWFTFGCARAVVYAASLYYGLHSDLPKGFAVGFHETLIGAAFTFGPLVAGGLAQAFTPRAPFAFVLFSTFAAVAILGMMWRRMPTEEARKIA